MLDGVRAGERTGKEWSLVSYILDEKEAGNSSETVQDQPPKTPPVLQRKRALQAEAQMDTDDRILELKEALKLEKDKSEDLLRRLQYLQADFENYRRRVEKEMGDVRRSEERRVGLEWRS